MAEEESILKTGVQVPVDLEIDANSAAEYGSDGNFNMVGMFTDENGSNDSEREWRVGFSGQTYKIISFFFQNVSGGLRYPNQKFALYSSDEGSLYTPTNARCSDFFYDTGFYMVTSTCTGKYFVLRRENNGSRSGENNYPLRFNELRLYQSPNLLIELKGTATIESNLDTSNAAWSTLSNLINDPSIGNSRAGEAPYIDESGNTGTD